MTSEEGGRVEVGGRESFPTASLKPAHASRAPAEPNGPNPFAGGERRFAPTNPSKNVQNLRLHFGTFFGKKCISRPIRKKVTSKRGCLLRFLPSFSAFENWFFFPRENWAVFRPRPICRRFDKSLLGSWQLSVGQFAATGKLRRRAPCTVSPRSKRWAACTVFGAAVRTLFSLASFCHRLLRQVRVTSPLQWRTVVANSEKLRSRNPIKRGEPGA